MKLEGKVAIVTGGGRGIGRAIALRLAKEGAAVVVTARTASEIKAVAAEIETGGGRAKDIGANLSSEPECANVVAVTRQAFGPPDILVNNAAIYGPVRPIEQITAAEWDEVLAINLRAAHLMMRLVLPEMYERGRGAIVNLSSVAAKAAYQWGAPYAASKAGIVALTRTAAAEGARKGVRVNAVSPGPVPETRLSQDLGRELARRVGGDPEKMFAAYLEGILQGRPQKANEIAAAVLFLVSDEASAITGQVLNVDGGMAFY